MKKPTKEAKSSCHTDDEGALHPDHTKEVHRINRIRGQLDGVARMLEERRYCPDIITQVEAIRAALVSFQSVVLERHLSECVRGAFTSSKASDREEKIEELIEIFKRR